MKDILEKFYGFLKEKNIKSYLITYKPNVLYLSKFKSSNAYVLCLEGEFFFFTDSRYIEGAKEKIKHMEVINIEGSFLEFISKFLKAKNVDSIYVDKTISYAFYEELSKHINVRFEKDPTFSLRKVKSKEEINIMKDGVKKSDAVYRRLLDFVKPGMTEKDVKDFVVCEFLKEKAQKESFDTIVATGKNSAVPHHETSFDVVENDKPLLVDMGLMWEHYATDFTRTFHIGKPSEEFLKVYEIVKDAHLFAIEKAISGNYLKDVDLAARSYIESKGYGDYFTHSTGHGVGLEIHEDPRVYKTSEDIIEEGFVFTVEPGIYLPNHFGVRLENIVYIENGLPHVMSSIPLDLVIL
ncbi:MAG: aminopeptidase P family protein [Hydrogenobaculum sp.]|nr:MAG: aminopeptidase P family protein [Hydrogenobaculum sp.]